MDPITLDAPKVSEFTHSQTPWRGILFLGAVLGGVIAYHYGVDTFDPNRNILEQIKRVFQPGSYTFSSGTGDGLYIEIGKHLQKKTKDADWSITITNEESLGGFDNAMYVMATPNSFGLLQEDTLPENSFIREHLRYVTPLYMERMHIIYNHIKYLEFHKKYLEFKGQSKYKEKDLDIPPNPSLCSKGDTITKDFFSGSEISIGAVGSGTRIFASYLLNLCEIGPINDRALKFSEGLKQLQKKEGGIDILFFIGGAPIKKINSLLKGPVKEPKKFKLMSIDSALVPEINNKYNLKLGATNFKGKYPGGQEISTVGSWSFLISSNDVPDSSIMELLTFLDELKEDSSFQTESDDSLDSNSPLKEFRFKSKFEQEYGSYLMETLLNLFIFIVTVALTTAGILIYLSWVVSGIKKVSYFKEMIKIYEDFLPTNSQLKEGTVPLPKPIIHEDQIYILSQLVKGISQLLRLNEKVKASYDAGGISMTHYQHIFENIADIKEMFQKNLARRINEYLSSANNDLDPDLLRHYYTAGYLTREDYGILRPQAKSPNG